MILVHSYQALRWFTYAVYESIGCDIAAHVSTFPNLVTILVADPTVIKVYPAVCMHSNEPYDSIALGNHNSPCKFQKTG
jgi:hypothetical protein